MAGEAVAPRAKEIRRRRLGLDVHGEGKGGDS